MIQLNGNGQMPQQNVDLNILNDWNQPFNEQRIAALDQVVQYMYRGNPAQVRRILSHIYRTAIF